jgi:hypothetical protein
MPHDKHGVCATCGRETTLTFHHLIPRKMHRRTHFKKHYAKDQLQDGIDVCRCCHRGIHDTYDEMTLAKEFDSLELILADDMLQRHFAWAAKQK